MEQVSSVIRGLAWTIWEKFPHAWKEKARTCLYHQERNAASYESRKRKQKTKRLITDSS
ncbi:MAG: hypothetical protein GX455_10135 [Phycisphaerae bacterium]|nr:hypothetical protein [Phycisphaerae bacterium]